MQCATKHNFSTQSRRRRRRTQPLYLKLLVFSLIWKFHFIIIIIIITIITDEGEWGQLNEREKISKRDTHYMFMYKQYSTPDANPQIHI